MQAASAYLVNTSLMAHCRRCSAIASSHLPAQARSYRRTHARGITHAGPAIQPTPPSFNTNSGMCAEALNTLMRAPMRLSMVRMRPVLPEASLTYSMLAQWDKASSTSIGMSPPSRPGLVYSVIEVCGSASATARK